MGPSSAPRRNSETSIRAEAGGNFMIEYHSPALIYERQTSKVA